MHWFLKFILEWSSTCFGQFLCQSSGVFHSTHSSGMSYRLQLVLASRPVWHIPLLCVQWKTPDDGQRNCSKYVVSFQNKFEKLVRLVGFIISICHDARSHEHKKLEYNIWLCSIYRAQQPSNLALWLQQRHWKSHWKVAQVQWLAH